MLKGAVEVHIFLLVAIALVLKGLRCEAGGEQIHEFAYDFLLIASFVSARLSLSSLSFFFSVVLI